MFRLFFLCCAPAPAAALARAPGKGNPPQGRAWAGAPPPVIPQQRVLVGSSFGSVLRLASPCATFFRTKSVLLHLFGPLAQPPYTFPSLFWLLPCFYRVTKTAEKALPPNGTSFSKSILTSRLICDSYASFGSFCVKSQ